MREQTDRVLGVEAARHTSRSRRSGRASARSWGHDGTAGVEDLQREARAVLERSAVLVARDDSSAARGSSTADSRARMWSSSRSKPAASARRVAAQTNWSRTRSMSARVISRGTWLAALVGDRRRARAAASCRHRSGTSIALPHQPRRRPCGRECPICAPIVCRRVRGRSRRSAASASMCSSRVHARAQPGVIRPVGRDADHLRHHQRRRRRAPRRPRCTR